MSAIGKRKIAKMDNEYVQQSEKAGIAASRKRKLLYRRLAVFFTFAFIVTAAMIATFVSQSSVLAQKQEELQEQEEKLAKLQKRQQVLEEEIVKLNDEEYIAKLARRDFFLSDKGEIIFHLPE